MSTRGWVTTDATVANSIEYHTKAGPCYSVVFTYVVGGSWYGGTFTTMKFHADGALIPLQYDPASPQRNSLTRQESFRRIGYWIFFILLGILAVYLFFGPK